MVKVMAGNRARTLLGCGIRGPVHEVTVKTDKGFFEGTGGHGRAAGDGIYDLFQENVRRQGLQ